MANLLCKLNANACLMPFPSWFFCGKWLVDAPRIWKRDNYHRHVAWKLLVRGSWTASKSQWKPPGPFQFHSAGPVHIAGAVAAQCNESQWFEMDDTDSGKDLHILHSTQIILRELGKRYRFTPTFWAKLGQLLGIGKVCFEWWEWWESGICVSQMPNLRSLVV